VRFAKINAKHALMGHLATFVKRLLLSKTQESFLFALVLQAPIQLQTMIVQIVSQIVSLVQMQHPVTLVIRLHLRLWHEYFQIVNAQYIIIVNQILTVYLAWINAKHALMEHLATFVKKLLLNKTRECSLFVLVL
jgi:hypothetical protein